MTTDPALARRLQEATRAVVGTLPEVEEASPAGQHYAFTVRGKKFAYFLDDHHGDGRIVFQCKMPPGEMGRLVEMDPEKFAPAPYMARYGWVSVYIDRGEVDWDEIAGMAAVAWSLTAPKSVRDKA